MKFEKHFWIGKFILFMNCSVFIISIDSAFATSIGVPATPANGSAKMNNLLASASVYQVANAGDCNNGDSLAAVSDIDFALNYALEIDAMVYFLTNALSWSQLEPGTYALRGGSNSGVTCTISSTKSCLRTIKLTSSLKVTSGINSVGFLCVKSGSAVATRAVGGYGSGFGEPVKSSAQ